MDQHFLNTYEPVCKTLCKVGWFATPYIRHVKFVDLEVICRRIDSEPVLDAQKKLEYANEVSILLTGEVFHPNYRAFFIYRSKEVSHVLEYSHLYERSVYHYYKSDYLSSVLTLLPAVEGALLSYNGWILGQGRKPKDFLTKLRTETINTGNLNFDLMFAIYGRVLADFLEQWIFSDTSVADFSTSYLNRHVLAHGMTPANINRQLDANRLILFFDILISYLSIPARKYYIFIPTDNEAINKRAEYLTRIIFNDEILLSYCINIEESFLKENKNYVAPEEFNVAEALRKNQTEMLESLAKISIKSKIQ